MVDFVPKASRTAVKSSKYNTWFPCYCFFFFASHVSLMQSHRGMTSLTLKFDFVSAALALTHVWRCWLFDVEIKLTKICRFLFSVNIINVQPFESVLVFLILIRYMQSAWNQIRILKKKSVSIQLTQLTRNYAQTWVPSATHCNGVVDLLYRAKTPRTHALTSSFNQLKIVWSAAVHTHFTHENWAVCGKLVSSGVSKKRFMVKSGRGWSLKFISMVYR